MKTLVAILMVSLFGLSAQAGPFMVNAKRYDKNDFKNVTVQLMIFGGLQNEADAADAAEAMIADFAAGVLPSSATQLKVLWDKDSNCSVNGSQARKVISKWISSGNGSVTEASYKTSGGDTTYYSNGEFDSKGSFSATVRIEMPCLK